MSAESFVQGHAKAMEIFRKQLAGLDQVERLLITIGPLYALAGKFSREEYRQLESDIVEARKSIQNSKFFYDRISKGFFKMLEGRDMPDVKP